MAIYRPTSRKQYTVQDSKLTRGGGVVHPVEHVCSLPSGHPPRAPAAASATRGRGRACQTTSSAIACETLLAPSTIPAPTAIQERSKCVSVFQYR